ncbi:uncharacterized protein F4812DRAFT_420161 [Daldinia caldariorum]|uniref:uncharacterized protein n=1 Tax=Daldinia caldariorum TaxID=326644 RepID=UPI002008262E|nr:uncharacterized protein F4812DRAFT_420161 [Daldinia caldariorum]KAI1469738.1 hypothetical protein F4812DRAFT_420161 [Daldinia caldariorum]
MASTSRRFHHKSRAGCATCKAKKVKCDEKQPCSYCARRQLPCSLVPASLPGNACRSGTDTDTPEGIGVVGVVVRPYEEPSFSFTDFALFQHFVKAASIAQADDRASIAVWRETIPDLATRYPYLLHELLAVAALHVRSANPEQANLLERIAAEHQARAIPLFREALANSSAETAAPLFACSCLLIPYHFAAAKDAASLLFNEDSGSDLAEWLVLIHGTAAVTMEHAPSIMRSPLRALLGDLSPPKPAEALAADGPTDARLVRLGEQLPVAEEQHRAEYEQVMYKLRVSFYLSDHADTALDRKNAALRFPPFVNRRRVGEDLAARRPAALVVMAYWCVLLHRAEERWWLRGRAEPLLMKIGELLPAEHRHLLAWPMEEVGICSRGNTDGNGLGIT